MSGTNIPNLERAPFNTTPLPWPVASASIAIHNWLFWCTHCSADTVRHNSYWDKSFAQKNTSHQLTADPPFNSGADLLPLGSDAHHRSPTPTTPPPVSNTTIRLRHPPLISDAHHLAVTPTTQLWRPPFDVGTHQLPMLISRLRC